MGNLARQLELESLEKELAARRRDFAGVDQKYRRETNPPEKNALEAQRDDLLADIRDIENRLEGLGVDRDRELIEILQPAFQELADAICLAYRCALPSRQIGAAVPRILNSLIVDLKLRGNGETHTPIHKFMGYLLSDDRLDINLKERLGAWLREEMADLSPLLDGIEQEKQHRRARGNPCLLVSVSKREAQYVAEAWIIDHPEDYDSSHSASGCHQIKLDGKAEWLTDPTLKQMPVLLRRCRDWWVEQSYDTNGDTSIRQIHVFLPSELINHSVDGWKIVEDEEDEWAMTLGEDYEVMLRYSERLRERTEAILKWREKGRRMRQQLDQPATDFFVLGNDANPKTLLRQLKEETTIAVKLASVPRPKDLGTLLLKAGIPLALWIRKPLPDVDCPSELETLLGSCAVLGQRPLLQEVPIKVKSKRLEAYEADHPDSHVGRHLALLWDDPELIPPKQLLSQQTL